MTYSYLISWVHGEEDSELRIHVHVVAVCEDEMLPLLFLAGQNHGNLNDTNKTGFKNGIEHFLNILKSLYLPAEQPRTKPEV